MSLRPEWTPIKLWVGTWNAANLDPPFDQLPLRRWLLGSDDVEIQMYMLGGGMREDSKRARMMPVVKKLVCDPSRVISAHVGYVISPASHNAELYRLIGRDLRWQ